MWLPARGRLEAQPGGGRAARIDLSTHVEKRLYALFASGEFAFLPSALVVDCILLG